MPSINLGGKLVDSFNGNVYIIAEIGQNHQGCMETAKKMIEEAKSAGCDCVKFQKSNLPSKFTKAALSRKYDSNNSWGATYGAHKEYLEFSDSQYKELQMFSKKIDIDFTASAMDEHSLHVLNNMEVPFIKIGSGDANNFRLLKIAAKMHTPLVISTGMQSMQTVDEIVKIMKMANKKNYALLHCVSSYPTSSIDCRLHLIAMMKKRYPNIIVGYSGHECGIDISKAAVLCGANIIERHFTLDKSLKGSDHKCSLDPVELTQLVREIKLLNKYLHDEFVICKEEIINILDNCEDVKLALSNTDDKRILQSELACKNKLGKSIVAATDMSCGKILQESDIAIKVSEPNGIPAEDYYKVIGMKLLCNIKYDEPILQNYLMKSL